MPGNLKCHACYVALAMISSSWVFGEEAKDVLFFEQKIRPVLVTHCYSCHSAHAKKAEGGLLLDSADGMKTGGDSGPAIVPSEPDASLILSALRYEGLEMPPDRRLPADVARDFEKWIAAGAADPRTDATSAARARNVIDIEQGRQFWAFQPVRDHKPPSAEPPVLSIDAFLDARLADNAILPNAKAEAQMLVRRLSFDLTGLPPTELQMAVADHPLTMEAWESLIEEFLGSPQFGVHWGRHWLDVARYADSNGGDFNATFHNAWRYRNYVLDAFNQDKPFDLFVREQIAGDLLPFDDDEQRAEQLIATGFLMTGTKMLSERDKVKLQMDVVDEQINTLGASFLGLTLGCARCHDHKFDPIPTADYYALAGIFRSTRTLHGESQKYVSTWKKTKLPVDSQHAAAVHQHQADVKKIESALKREKAVLASLKSMPDDRFVVDDVQALKVGEWRSSRLTPTFVGKGYIHDDQKQKGEKSVTFTWSVPETGEYEIRFSYTSGANRAKNVPIQIASGDSVQHVTLDQTSAPPIDQKFASLGRFQLQQPDVTVRVSTENTKGYVIVDAVHFVPSTPPAHEDKTEVERRRLEKSGRQEQLVSELEKKLAELRRNVPPPLPEAIAATENEEIGDCEICIRGEHDNPGPGVPRGFLQVMTDGRRQQIPAHVSGRKELAEWIASPKNPLTARVLVNRVWAHLMGQGLVRSVDNFGRLGERPDHPSLLDHLAARFVTPVDTKTEQGGVGFGWSTKSLVREIVLTKAYQRSSDHDERSEKNDPENRLLWKAHRRRLPAEAIRDTMLAVSGQLDLSAGKSPVKGLGTLVKANNSDAKEYRRQQSVRRSVYLPIIRNELPPILTVFDFADPDLVVGRRAVTNVPTQALFLLNSPFVMDAAERAAAALCEDTSVVLAEVIQRAYRKILSRTATPDEVQTAMRFLQIDDSSMTFEAASRSDSDGALSERFARFVHVMMASTEFRMLN